MTKDQKIDALVEALQNCIITLNDVEQVEGRLPVLRHFPIWQNLKNVVIDTSYRSRLALKNVRTEEKGK